MWVTLIMTLGILMQWALPDGEFGTFSNFSDGRRWQQEIVERLSTVRVITESSDITIGRMFRLCGATG